MKNILLVVIATLFLITSCGHQVKKSNTSETTVDPNMKVFPALNDSLHKELMVQGAILVHKAMFGIKSNLMDALKKGGPQYALEFCNLEAIPITDSLADVLQVGVKRIAKKYRNPDNEMKGAENKIYKEYIMNYIAGQPPKTRVEIDANGHPVYYKLIDVKQECLVCHGRPDVEIPSDVAKRIKELYPNDLATDFAVGQPRGMWAITFNDILIQNKKP